MTVLCSPSVRAAAFGFCLFHVLSITSAQAQCYFLECGSPPPPAPAPSPTPQPMPLPSSGRSYWNHNGSVMYLVVSGNKREFYYHRPRQGMIEEGVRSGTLLFSGYVSGNSYQGVAYFFSARCGPRPYNVNGPVQENGGRVTMAGAGTVINDRCQLVGTINDTLVFDFLYKE